MNAIDGLLYGAACYMPEKCKHCAAVKTLLCLFEHPNQFNIATEFGGGISAQYTVYVKDIYLKKIDI